MANRQHWIATVKDSINNYDEIASAYFDGTETQARKHFKTCGPFIAKYFGNSRYQIVMKANAIVLQDA